MKTENGFMTRNRYPMLLLLAIVLTLSAGCEDQAGRQLEQAADEGRAQIEEIAGGADGGGESDATLSAGETYTVTVASVTDGDTVDIGRQIRGRTDVRLIGVDTPELSDSEPLSRQAAEFTTRRLEGERVRLTLGEEPVDPYDRLLGNVVPVGEERMQGELLLERGLGQTLFYEPNTAHQMLFSSIQENARQRQIGIWGLPPAKQCLLTNRGNGIGEGSAGC